jgi:hypothetical protein
MWVIVFDNGDPKRVELIGPFSSEEAAQDWGRAALDPFDAAWMVERITRPTNLPGVYL